MSEGAVFFSYVTQFVVWVLCRCTAEGALLKVGRGCRASSSADLGSRIYGRSSTCSRPIRQALSYLALSCPYVHAIYTLAFGTHLRARGSPQTAQSPQRAYNWIAEVEKEGIIVNRLACGT